jgi:hypothetical protein
VTIVKNNVEYLLQRLMQGGATVTAEESAFGLLSGLQVKRAMRKGATAFRLLFVKPQRVEKTLSSS